MENIMNHEGEGMAKGDAQERLVIPSAALGGRSVPAEILIAPWGTVESVNGLFVVDECAARMAIEAFREHGTDIPLDYEHQSLGGSYASPNGLAPAAGWIRGLRVVTPEEAGNGPAGLMADVEWTDAGRGKVEAREYRYLSPVVIVRKSDRRVVALHSVALTNKPAIRGMKPIVNRVESVAERGSIIEESPEPTGKESFSSSETNPADVAGFETLRLRLELPAEAEVGAVLAEADARLASYEEKVARYEAEDRVASAIRAGKLSPAQKEWAMALAMKDPQGWEAWLASAPQVVTLGRTQGPGSGVGEARSRERSAVIASARRTFRSETGLRGLTDEPAWINDALREAGFCVLSGDEREATRP